MYVCYEFLTEILHIMDGVTQCLSGTEFHEYGHVNKITDDK